MESTRLFKAMFRVSASRLVRWLLVAAAIYLTLMVLSRWLFPDHTIQKSTEGLASELDESKKQEIVDYIAENLDVRYEVLNNLVGNYAFTGRITLINSGNKPINVGPWMIFLYQNVDFEHVVKEYVGTELANRQLRITHINGGIFKLQPTYLFHKLEPGARLRFQFEGGRWITARSLVYPNWYVHVAGAEPKVIKSTADESLSFVGDFDKEPQWKSNSQDRNSPFTPEERYKRNVLEKSDGISLGITPTPLMTKKTKPGRVTFDAKSWVVVGNPAMKNEVTFLAEKLGLRIVPSQPTKNFIRLHQGTVELTGADVIKTKAYSLTVDSESEAIDIMSPGPEGAFYGCQSLLSLLANNQTLPNLKVLDAPRFRYRGVMLDVVRNFFSKDAIKRVIDVMSMYKLNRLHLHLTDDEAWRIEIPDLPELTKVASRRCHDLEEDSCLLPFLGSGPSISSSGSGFYSVEDYKDILRYAKVHHIMVIPEVDMPGHSHAAIKAMEARYRRLMSVSRKDEAEKYLLSDPLDKSSFLSVQQFKDNAINVCLDSAFTFLDKVISTLVEMHQDVSPLKVIHIGGDEIPGKALTQSPACAKMMKEQHQTQRDGLIKMFIEKAMALGSKYNVLIQGWEDLFYNDGKLHDLQGSQQNIANVWKNVWSIYKFNRAHDMANNNYKVVLGPATHLYLDHPHEPDPEEWGNYWATRYIDTHKVFGFMPENFYANIDVSLYGQPLSREELCRSKQNCPKLNKPENIAGMECHVWAEIIRTEDRLHHMLFPRMLAMAERAWHRADWELELDDHSRARQRDEDWSRFINTVGFRELHRLEKMGIKYHLPAPGVIIQDGRLNVNSALPGLPFVASSDNGQTWLQLENENKVSGQILIATSTRDHTRHSRPVKIKIS